jgi:uncharacterized protein YkwD
VTRLPMPHPGRRMSSAAGRRLALALAALLMASSAIAVQPSPVAADTASDMEALILRTMNEDRTARGLVAYRAWGALATLAGERAQNMADANTLSHAAAGGDLGAAFDSRGIQWFGFGETIGVSGWPFGSQAALDIYNLWKGSAPHRSIMFSSEYNYVGIGVAQGKDGRAWVSAVYAESVDHTAPVASNGKLWRVGRTIYFRFGGYDRRLQSHTAGLRSFDVQLRRDNGAWRTVRNDITWTKIRLKNRARGHWFSLRVQSADRRGTLSAWTSAKRIWMP